MLIESTNSQPQPPRTGAKPLPWPLFLGTTFVLTSGFLFFVFFLPWEKPTGTLLSPLPGGELAATDSPTPALSFAASLNLAQNYLSKAYDLARNQNQNDEDKKAILTSLNRSLKQVDDSIRLDPQNPQGYLLRAQILTAISKINKKALDLAKQDFDTASRLSQNQNVVLPPTVNPVDLLPDERAAVAVGPLIAAPATTSGVFEELTPEVNSNASQGRVILPAGTAELEVANSQVLDSSYIYLIPQGKTNNPVYVKSKSSASFTIAASLPADTDLTIDYYIITD